MILHADLIKLGFTQEETWMDFLYEKILNRSEYGHGDTVLVFYSSNGFYDLTIKYGIDGGENWYCRKYIDSEKILNLINRLISENI